MFRAQTRDEMMIQANQSNRYSNHSIAAEKARVSKKHDSSVKPPGSAIKLAKELELKTKKILEESMRMKDVEKAASIDKLKRKLKLDCEKATLLIHSQCSREKKQIEATAQENEKRLHKADLDAKRQIVEECSIAKAAIESANLTKQRALEVVTKGRIRMIEEGFDREKQQYTQAIRDNTALLKSRQGLLDKCTEQLSLHTTTSKQSDANKKKLEDAERRIESLTENITQLTIDKDALAKQVKASNEKLSSLYNDNLGQLEAKIAIKREEIRDIGKYELSKLQSINRLALERVTKEATKHSKKTSEFSSNINAKLEELYKLDTLKTQGLLKKCLDGHDKEIALLDSKYSNSIALLHTNKLAEIDRLNKTTERRLAKKVKEIDALKYSVEQLRSSHVLEIKRVTDRLDDDNEVIVAEIKRDTLELTETVAEQKRIIATINNDKDELREQLRELARKLKEASEAQKRLEAKQVDLVSEHKRKLKDIQKKHKSNIARLSSENVKVTAVKVASLEKKILELSDKLTKAIQARDSIQTQKDVLTCEITQVKTLVGLDTHRLAACKTLKSDLENSVRVIIESEKSGKQTIRQLTKKTTQLEAFEQENKALAANIQSANSKILELEEKLKIQEALLLSKESATQKALSEIAEAEKKLTQLGQTSNLTAISDKSIDIQTKTVNTSSLLLRADFDKQLEILENTVLLPIEVAGSCYPINSAEDHVKCKKYTNMDSKAKYVTSLQTKEIDALGLIRLKDVDLKLFKDVRNTALKSKLRLLENTGYISRSFYDNCVTQRGSIRAKNMNCSNLLKNRISQARISKTGLGHIIHNTKWQ